MKAIEMKTDVYEKLARVLDLLPGGYPQTKSGIELQILRKIFSLEEALMATKMTGTMEPVDTIAARANLSEEETEEKLKAMGKRGIVWGSRASGMWKFRLAPFILGFYEATMYVGDHELAHLCEQYFNEGGMAGLMRPEPAFMRAVPAQQALKTEVILPYDDIRALILQSKSFELRDCVCRKQQDLAGKRKCDFPLRVCLAFLPKEKPMGPISITQEEALKVLDQTEDVGLVHCVRNVATGVYAVCNCCGCCCGILRGITEFGIESSVARANYYAVVDPDECNGCGVCEDRCQVNACSVDTVAKIDLAKCIGCGLCVTGCSNEAVTLELRPDAEIIHPPENYAAWEQQRLGNRGLLK